MHFSDIEIGDKASVEHLITENDIGTFVDLTGDDNRLHTDEEYAKTTAFKKPVAHGMLGASFISTVIGTRLPGDGTLWLSQNLEFILPVRIGDRLTVVAEVIKKFERDQIIELRTDIFNQQKQKVTGGIARVKIIKPTEQKKPEISKTIQKKVALVIGSSGGIGQITALKLADDGFDLVLHYYSNSEVITELKAKIENLGRKVILVKGDITNENDVAEILRRTKRHFGQLTVLVNTATAPITTDDILNMEWTDIETSISVNLKGVFYLIKHAVPLMEENGYGKIINFSTQAVDVPNNTWISYITSKSALNGFSKSLALSLAKKGIRLNLISPGMTDTDLIANIPEKARLLSSAKTPLKRIATPDDVANAVSYLASDKSDYLTGETIRVNGGQVMI